MPRRTDAELGRLVRLALKGHRIKPRRLDLPTAGMCYGLPRPKHWREVEESDNDFLGNNVDAAVALLEALAKPRRKERTP